MRDLLPGAFLAGLGLVMGASWQWPPVHGLDARLMLRLNRADAPKAIDTILAALRILGTTPFFVTALILVAIAALQPRHAFGLVVAVLAAEGLTKGVKILARRARPFEQDSRVVLRLARQPTDAGFPSGDAMRAAFLAGVAWVVIPSVGWLAAPVAVIVGLGRIRAGAHYPLDVWAGWCVGLGASLAWFGL